MSTMILASLAAAVSVSIVPQSDGTRTLVHEAVVDAPASEVWRAVSSADGWKTWAVPVAWAPQPDVIETSYAKDAKPGDETTIRQKVLLRVPERLMLFQTTKAPAGFPNFETYRKVVNLLEVEAVGQSRTRVRLTAAGYQPTDAGKTLLAFFEKGNGETLEQLQAKFDRTPATGVSGKLAPLNFLVGHCWRGDFATTGQQDTHCFESVFDGAHVRDRHEVTGKADVYRGESLYSWNPAAKKIEYVYWNSLGGVSRGNMVATVDRLDFDNETHVRADGSKAIYSTSWRRKGADAYEVVSKSNGPTGEKIIVYNRVN